MTAQAQRIDEDREAAPIEGLASPTIVEALTPDAGAEIVTIGGPVTAASVHAQIAAAQAGAIELCAQYAAALEAAAEAAKQVIELKTYAPGGLAGNAKTFFEKLEAEAGSVRSILNRKS